MKQKSVGAAVSSFDRVRDRMGNPEHVRACILCSGLAEQCLLAVVERERVSRKEAEQVSH